MSSTSSYDGPLGTGGFMSSGAYTPSATGSFPDPFMDMSSLAMPTTIMYANRWCEFLMFANGTYSRALDRVLSYFITDVEVKPIGDGTLDSKRRDEIKSYLYDDLDILDAIHTAGMNYMVYGNDFSSVLVPFRRSLMCPQCHIDLPLKVVYENDIFRFQWAGFEFHALCPKCKYTGVWKHVDRRGGEEGKLKIRNWSPHEIELLWDPYTDDVKYIWKIPEDYRKVIREGHLHHLERAPWEIIEAVKDNKHLQFEDNFLYHMKETTLAGIRNRGWGISRVLSNFRQAWYVQVLHRYNEAIALDYVIPFRVITPAPGPGSGDQAKDTLLNMNMGGFMGQINRMLRVRKKDPATWHTLPFPVQYQAMGGDATQLAPKDLLDQGIEVLLHNVGVPVELYKGSLSVQSAPAALRLFESQWSHLVHVLNGFIAFVLKRAGMLRSWDPVKATLRKVTHADDMNREAQKLQLMLSGMVSKTTALNTIGVNYRDEIRESMDEQAFEAEQQEKQQDKLQQSATMTQMTQPPQPGQPGDPAAGGGGAPPAGGGDPAAAGGGGGGGGVPPPQGGPGAALGQAANSMPSIPNKPTTPQEMQAKAQQIAQQMLSLPDSQRQSELIQLKKTDPNMHAIVSAQIDDTRQKAQTAGGAMLLQQQFQQKQGSRNPRYIDLDD